MTRRQKGGWYCDRCGALHAHLPAGAVSCQRCGGQGLFGYNNAAPRRVPCPAEGCHEQVWDDGGVNSMHSQHVWQRHEGAPISTEES